ncbi:MAG: two-component system response regulator, partial [Alphaproteobacteria bacterium]
MSEGIAIERDEDRSLLIVDDDGPFRNRLARAMEKRGFDVRTAETVTEGLDAARASPP